MRCSCTYRLLILSAGLWSTAAISQETSTPFDLGTIVISSTKRDVSDLALPIASTVLSAEDVPVQTLDPTEEIARQSPGTNFVDNSRFSDSYLTMRGVATLGNSLNNLDNTVGFSIDGVPTSISGLNAPLLDVDRIEVLKGPQGTTFGRNALAGSINIVSRVADGVRQRKVELGFGTDGFGLIEATSGGWIVPGKLAARGVIRLETFDGDIPNLVIGGTDGAADISAGRVALRFTPDDTLTIDVAATFSKNENTDPSNILRETARIPISGQDIRPRNEQQIANASVTVEKEFEALRFTSVTSFQDVRTEADSDFTDAFLFAAASGLPPTFFNNPNQDVLFFNEDERIFNQEFRLSSLDGAPLKWVFGASYFQSDFDFSRFGTSTVFPGFNGTVNNVIDSETIALFGDASVSLGKRWTISGGLRFARDEQTLRGNYISNGFPGTVPTFLQNVRFSDDYTTGRAALSYAWSDQISAYASIARGYSSGGFEKGTQFAPFGAASVPFRPAQSWTYEIGTKAQITDNLRFDGAFFFNDVSDGQLSAFDAPTLTVFFANQDYESYGFEGRVNTSITSRLNVSAGISLIETKLVNVTAASAAAGAAPGNKVPQVPEMAANLRVNYRFNLNQSGVQGNFVASASYQFVGERFSDIRNAGRLPSYHLVNLRLGWQNDKLSVYAFANNVFDRRYLHSAVPIVAGASASYAGRGRIVGVGLSVEW